MTLRIAICLIVISTSTAALAHEPGSTTGGGSVDYVRDVKPILAANCLACHGADESTRKAGLRLDRRDDAIKRLESGETAIVPKKPEASELWKRINSHDTDVLMPPPSSKKTLTAAEKETLKKWIANGAEYKEHWAFTKPVRPVPPQTKTSQNPIDSFTLATLKAKGLTLAPQADRNTLIRRVSLDVRGFGPSPAEIDEFLKDKSTLAYNAMVARMLASPHYGEKMAQLWLDLARFGDTSGYHYDSTRQMWLWRDWVINAYNTNLPFDQFTIQQIAGDLVPLATREMKIATGFNRNTRFNEEGGADPEEFVVRYSVDRTNTLGQVWLGMTVGCAECHSHKYDPISHKEYYQLSAFFTGIKEPMASGNHGQALAPLLRVSTQAQDAALAKAQTEKAAVARTAAFRLALTHYAEPDPKTLAKLKVEPTDTIWVDDGLPAGANPQGTDGDASWAWVRTVQDGPIFKGQRSMRRQGTGIHQHFFTGATSPLLVKGTSDVLFAYVYLDPKNPPKTVMLQWNDGTWEHRAYWGEDKAYSAGSADAVNHRKMGPLPKTGAWVRLEVPVDKVGFKAGTKITGMAFSQFDGLAYWDAAGIQTTPEDPKFQQSLSAWATKAKTEKDIPKDVTATAKLETAKRTPAQTKNLRDYFVRYVWADAKPRFEKLNAQVVDLDHKIKELEDAMPTVMISEEMDKPRPAHILHRGDFLQKGEKVEPGVPAIFPPMPVKANTRPTRLDLAQWLVNPDHPLTSRVAVNRFWAQCFGMGLVKTLGDFGTQGEQPSHAELLDWLAVEFMATGWDTKKLFTLILTSETYKQSSIQKGHAPDSDPNNRLLWRGPRFRLSAEEIRDHSLKVSGLLNDKVGGPSFMPYQPADFYKGKMEGWGWTATAGDDQYRRGLYTFWRRTSLHPMFALFDAPSREECTAFRPRTITPLQALVTMNDPTFVEAARVFAQKTLSDGPKDDDARLQSMFRKAVARDATIAEMAVLKKQLRSLKEKYKADPKNAAELVKAGQYAKTKDLDPVEHAAWMGLANLILNLDETLTRE